jgi:hypothetical protein
MNGLQKILFLSFGSLFVLSACHKEESLYPAPTVAEGLQTQSFEMGEFYSQQLYFDFESQQKGSIDFGQWDIGFSNEGDPQIIICGGKNAQFSAAKLEGIAFEQVTQIDPKSLIWKYDHPEGHPDSMAITHAFLKTSEGFKGNPLEVYILDLGADTLLQRRFVKVRFESVSGGFYQFQWGYVYQPDTFYTVKLPTQPHFNYTYYSFSRKAQVQNEFFEKNKWDIVFTTYKEEVPHPIDGTLYPYIIRGVLINPGKIAVAQIDSIFSFNTFTYEQAKSLKYLPKINEIGYDWKIFDLNSSRYSIVPNRFFVIKTQNGNYFKLRFIDFYDDSGTKGFPKIAWQLLKP